MLWIQIRLIYANPLHEKDLLIIDLDSKKSWEILKAKMQGNTRPSFFDVMKFVMFFGRAGEPEAEPMGAGCFWLLWLLGSRSMFPEVDPDPDLAKWYGSNRILKFILSFQIDDFETSKYFILITQKLLFF